MSKDSKQINELTVSGKTWLVAQLEERGSTQEIKINDQELSVRMLREPTIDQPDLVASINGKVLIARKEEERDGSSYLIRLNGRLIKVSIVGREQSVRNAGETETVLGPVVITAPMSGRIVSLKVSPNTSVNKGQPLATLEAMKMENEIAAPKTGIVKEVYVQSGALVKAGDKLCFLE
ncbi:MAG TPA: biotin/lipoyl-containing protein [Candidatus Bathyarchaeia archaeon]|nr:biotin/lipoyl-containing protein [Candidatus Bathyarchaeia archaeon]